MNINPWQKLRKIVHLPGTRRTAEVALAQTLEKARAGRVKSVMILIEWDDGEIVADWSSLDGRTMAYMALLAQKEFMNVYGPSSTTVDDLGDSDEVS